MRCLKCSFYHENIHPRPEGVLYYACMLRSRYRSTVEIFTMVKPTPDVLCESIQVHMQAEKIKFYGYSWAMT